MCCLTTNKKESMMTKKQKAWVLMAKVVALYSTACMALFIQGAETTDVVIIELGQFGVAPAGTNWDGSVVSEVDTDYGDGEWTVDYDQTGANSHSNSFGPTSVPKHTWNGTPFTVEGVNNGTATAHITTIDSSSDIEYETRAEIQTMIVQDETIVADDLTEIGSYSKERFPGFESEISVSGSLVLTENTKVEVRDVTEDSAEWQTAASTENTVEVQVSGAGVVSLFAISGAASSVNEFSASVTETMTSSGLVTDEYSNTGTLTGEITWTVGDGERVTIYPTVRKKVLPIDLELYFDEDTDGLADGSLSEVRVENTTNATLEFRATVENISEP